VRKEAEQLANAMFDKLTVWRRCGGKMRRILEDELQKAPAQLALELSEVTRIDHDGVDALVAGATQAGEQDISFCLIVLRGGPVEKALAAGQLTDLFEIYVRVRDL
jgi:anti-anti-sigma regulatory factor